MPTEILIAIAADEPMHKACFDQSDVFAFLADPATHELREPIIRIDTHGAAVFLAGKNVYKVKRAVRFPFMDFSTLNKRRRACERELAPMRPEWVGEAAQQLVAAIMMDNRFAHHRAEAGHAICQPTWHLPAMQRKIGASSSLCHLFSCESLGILSSNGCRWALLCASAKAKHAKSCHLFSLARLQKPRLRPFRHNGPLGLMRLELARRSPCKRYRARAIRLRLKSRKISRAAL